MSPRRRHEAAVDISWLRYREEYRIEGILIPRARVGVYVKAGKFEMGKRDGVCVFFLVRDLAGGLTYLR